MKTPNYPLYKDARDKAPHEYPPSGNTGLWFTRFFNQYDEYKDDEGKSKSQKLEWLQDIAKNAIGDGKKIKDLNDRQRELCKSLGGTFIEVETQSNFVTGMGLSHPVENGFTFHPTLGVPYLPASSVKGLLRGWVEAWMDNDENDSTEYERWFGTTECSGELIFFDALPTKPVHLGCEIMTPHMGKWYEKGDENNPPADWYSPVPVPFLVVQPKTKFHFMIAPRLTGGDVTKAMEELKNALEWIGAGAKTASGYGRMLDTTPPPPPPAQTESWGTAKILLNPGTGDITASFDGKTTIPLKGNDANNFRSALGEDRSNSLKKKKELKNISVLVEKLGNSWKLVKTLS
ncbi:MAG: hypothetical protein RIR79_2126 [Pseudomonadota bacterium]|jgi:CRISPR-associated protein Cmr6